MVKKTIHTIINGDVLELTHTYPFRIGLISDLQVGAVNGIHPPNYIDSQTGQPYPLNNRGQKKLWKYMLNFIDTLKKYKINVLVVLGDLIGGQNWKDRGAYQMYTDMNIQIRACAELLSIICKKVPTIKAVYLFKGTPYHGSKDLSAEEQATNRLKSKYDINAIYRGEYAYLVLKHGKKQKRIFLTHPATGATVYPETPIGRDIGRFLQAYATGKLSKIDMIIRAHRHEYIEVHKSSIRSIILPCWQFFVPYDKAMKNFPNWQPDIGGVVLLADEELRLRPWHFTYPNVPDPTRYITLRHTSDPKLVTEKCLLKK